MKTETPLIADVVLVGGGHAHVHALKMFGMSPYKNLLKENGIRVTLISSCVLTPYSGMLPGLVSGHYNHEEIHLDLRKLCSFSGIRFIHAVADRITYESGGGGLVSCSNGRPDVRYDVISIDIGSNPSMPPALFSESKNAFVQTNIPGVTPVKPIASFSERWQGICEKIQNMPLKELSIANPFKLLIVGAGAGGIELALSAQYALHRNILRRLEKCPEIDDRKSLSEKLIQVAIATRGDDLLPSHNDSVRNIFRRILNERNINIHLGADAIGVDQDDLGGKKHLKLSSNSKTVESILFDECLWCTSAGASLWLRSSTPFETIEGGFLSVNDTYESSSHPGVFAAGDCCHMVSNPRPKAGVFAVRAGPILTQNIISYIMKQPLTSHTPQKDFLGIISTGDKYAVASRGCHALEGEFLWRLKDEIDRNWMSMYQNLPSMEDMLDENQDSVDYSKVPLILQNGSDDNILSAFMEAPMRCGGCGSKVGSQTLTRVLSAIHKRRVANCDKKGIQSSNQIHSDDAALVMIPSSGRAMVQTLDFFRSFISDPYVFGKVAAVHALSDCHAMGADAHVALALAVVNFAANEIITENTLIEMLSGASDVFDDEGCELSGGHTCEGLEQALGFSVTGFVQDPKHLLRKRGGQVGDKIILTKPIGTGALFAADMRAKCRGEYVEEALQSMMSSNGAASRVARQYTHDVHACTDVTGFGLIGHLIEMLIANDDSNEDYDSIGATIDLNAIPFLNGALEAASSGIFSSLQRENFRSRRAVQNHEDAANSDRIKYPLLFDPQTAGGLLLFVSPSVCDEFMSCLRKENSLQHVAVIGELFSYDISHSKLFCDSKAECVPTTNRVFVKV